MSVKVQHKTVKVDGLDIFYREAGDSTLPSIILFNGHASSSHTFRNLIPLIAGHFHEYQYTFANIAETMDRFTETLKLKKYVVELFDYGAPIRLLLASRHPERITGIFSQSIFSQSGYRQLLAASVNSGPTICLRTMRRM
ncbi:hypothetical protein NW762_003922 [Fusarium torreyae]|uniref:Uncharacterized protein n=1 Tax=Fusarium torreyae TaxID=1237075 RepID=A0A9W8S519_9HYPO|nr:hypothetical protein NW762_003922 [Fusarium torreyae]